MGPEQAALASYRGLTRSTRWHTRLRWWWCPFPVIQEAVPPAGDVLEVGCGHGLLSLYLAAAGPARHVRGVDIDATKIAEATAAAATLRPEANVTFETVTPDYLPEGPVDCVVFADVLYLLRPDAQRELVEAAADALRPGGSVLLKEMGLQPRWKARWNQVQETVATRVARVTEHTGAGLNFVDPEKMAGWMAGRGLETSVRRIDRGYPWPHHLIVGIKVIG